MFDKQVTSPDGPEPAASRRPNRIAAQLAASLAPLRSRSRSELWTHPNFLKLWAAETVSSFGSQVTAVALPLAAALALDASPGEMGFLTAAGTFPFLLIGLFVGVWVDRLRRRPLMIVADLARAALLVSIPLIWVAGALRIEVLYAIAFLVGSFTVVFEVAWAAYLPSLVRRDLLVDANSRLQASMSVAQVAGPGLAGTLVGLLTAPIALLVDALSYLASAALLARIRHAETIAPRAASRRAVFGDIGEGLRALFGQAELRALVASSSTVAVFGYAFLAVYVLYLTDDLGLGPGAVGLVFSLGGLGALAGAALAAPAARRFGLGRTLVGAQVLMGLSGLAIPFAVLVPDVALPLVLAAEFAQWMMILVYDVNYVSLRQAVVPDHLLGRVTATTRFLVSGGRPVGSLLGGLLGGLIGVPETLAVSELGLLAACLWVIFSPVRRLERLPEPEPARAAD